MLSIDAFTSLGYSEKKEVLGGIFQELLPIEPSFEDTLFLLNASTQIKETTLVATYTNLFVLLGQTKDLSGIKTEIKKAHTQITHGLEEKSEQVNAETLISDL